METRSYSNGVVIVETETQAPYTIDDLAHNAEDAVIARALEIMSKRIRRLSSFLTSPEIAKTYLILKSGMRETEAFGALLLDSNNGVIEDFQPFEGGVDEVRVYVRVLLKRALEVNATGMVLYHNHPSGDPRPSDADHHVTDHIKSAAGMFEMRVLDHIIVAGDRSHSFAEHGEL